MGTPSLVDERTSNVKEEVILLYKVWLQLDDAHSGRVDVTEFRAYCFSHHQNKLGEKIIGVLLGRKSSFVIEDLMRILWPCATGEDLKQAKVWIDEFVNTMRRIKTPPMLSKAELDALVQ